MFAKWTLLLVLALMIEVTVADDMNQRTRPAIVPRPAEMQIQPGVFCQLAPDLRVVFHVNDAEVRAVARYLATELSTRTGWPVTAVGPTAGSKRRPGGAEIELAIHARPELGQEGYALDVTPQGIKLQAGKARGLSRGVQTLRQLLTTVDVENASRSSTRRAWHVPCLTIRDKPRFRWRGMLLDCGRHFMSKEFIKRYIDLLAYHKMNVFHWHLTEDQGWRIEIKKYPKLTQIGAWRGPDDERYGGLYTQDDVREIVAYARSHYVTIVPEIELPGHCTAALAAYPELSCTGGPFEVSRRWGIHKEIYCAGNDETFAFLEGVLSEVIELFPSEYVHIGGDEVPKDRWKGCPKCQARIKAEGLAGEDELQSYFIRRIEKYLNSRGRRLIGWDEILEGGLAPHATVQSWRGMDGAIAAARAGHDVIVSPTSHCYLNFPQEPDPSAPEWMGLIALEQIYSFEPTPPELTAEQARHVLGGEGNVWTEYAPQERVDYQAFPRLCALAEVLWSPKGQRDWDDFQERMTVHYRRLDALGVQYHK
jgi:hexosaminidase